MRWFWIDRFIEFESGRRAVAIKNVSLAEEQVDTHFPGAPTMPNSIIIEGIAQTGGLLVAEHNGFEERVVLAKISKARFYFCTVPGDTLKYTATIEDIQQDGAMVSATSFVGDRLQAEVDIFFAHLTDRTAKQELFHPAEFLVTLRLLAMYDVGKNPDGSKIEVPPRLSEAERRADVLS